jgi:hypothetical protein
MCMLLLQQMWSDARRQKAWNKDEILKNVKTGVRGFGTVFCYGLLASPSEQTSNHACMRLALCDAVQLLVDGKFVPSKSGKTFKTINPVVRLHCHCASCVLCYCYAAPRPGLAEQAHA